MALALQLAHSGSASLASRALALSSFLCLRISLPSPDPDYPLAFIQVHALDSACALPRSPFFSVPPLPGPALPVLAPDSDSYCCLSSVCSLFGSLSLTHTKQRREGQTA